MILSHIEHVFNIKLEDLIDLLSGMNIYGLDLVVVQTSYTELMD